MKSLLFLGVCGARVSVKGKTPELLDVMVSNVTELYEEAVLETRANSLFKSSKWVFSKCQSLQRICKLSSSLEPPAESGLMWSILAFFRGVSLRQTTARAAAG